MLEDEVEEGDRRHRSSGYCVTTHVGDLKSRRLRSPDSHFFTLSPDRMHVHVPAFANQPIQKRSAPHQVQHSPARGFAYNQLRRVLFAGHAQQAANDIVICGGDNLRAKLPCQREMPAQAPLIFFR